MAMYNLHEGQKHLLCHELGACYSVKIISSAGVDVRMGRNHYNIGI